VRNLLPLSLALPGLGSKFLMLGRRPKVRFSPQSVIGRGGGHETGDLVSTGIFDTGVRRRRKAQQPEQFSIAWSETIQYSKRQDE
jgi:hypothetical protein